MFRITQRELRGLISEAMEIRDLADLQDSVSSAMEQLLHAESVCPRTPEFQAMLSMIEDARQNIDGVKSALAELVAGR